jgi:hypothetical protein
MVAHRVELHRELVGDAHPVSPLSKSPILNLDWGEPRQSFLRILATNLIFSSL